MNIEIRSKGIKFEYRIEDESDLSLVKEIIDKLYNKFNSKKMCSSCGKNEVDDLSDWCAECMNKN